MYIHIYLHVYIYMHMYVCMYVCMYACMYRSYIKACQGCVQEVRQSGECHRVKGGAATQGKHAQP